MKISVFNKLLGAALLLLLLLNVFVLLHRDAQAESQAVAGRYQVSCAKTSTFNNLWVVVDTATGHWIRFDEDSGGIEALSGDFSETTVYKKAQASKLSEIQNLKR